MSIEEFSVGTLRVVIDYEPDPECPRDWDNLGKMTIFDSGTNEHDEKPKDGEELIRLLALPFYEEESDKYRIRNGYATPELKELFDVVCANYITCVVRDITRGCGYAAEGQLCDVEWCRLRYLDGLVWVAKKDPLEEGLTEEQAFANLQCEIETYSAWATGAVYDYRITDVSDPEVHECCGGFYEVEDAAVAARSAAGAIRYVPQWY